MMRLLSANFAVGVRARLFGALALTGVLALVIGLAAFTAFDGLHAGITTVTAERFPAVVASARLERQHQRIMRTMEQLAAAADNLERETIAQGLSDQLTGYDRLLGELPQEDSRGLQQIGHLRTQYEEVVRLRDAIDAQAAERVAAARAMQDQARAATKIADGLEEPALRDHEDAAAQKWLAQAQRLLFLAASAHRVESRVALTRLATAARDGLRQLDSQGRLVPAALQTTLTARAAALAAVTDGKNSVFVRRQAQLDAGENLRGLLERANQVSLLITGLTTGIFVEQTNLAEESRNRLIAISDVYTKLFFAATLVVALVAVLALAYVQRSIVARLWAARDALRQRSEGLAVEIPATGRDEISELAQALNFYVRETEEKGEAIRRNERWLRATLEAAPMPLVISGRDDGKVRFINRRAAELLALNDRRSLLDRPASSIWRSPIVREGFVDEIVKHGVAVDIEAELTTEAGDVFWGLVSGVVIEFEGEKVLLVALADITRRRRAETLARRTQDELRKAKDRAEKADAAKTEFLATLSHEMRTPLNGILGLGRLLLTHGLGATERRHVRSIMRCGGALLDQVNDILDLRKIEDGKLDLDPVACPLAPFFDDVLATVEPMAEEKAITLNLSIADDLPAAIVVDPQRLRQIVINLVGNAVKFTERGGVWVRASREAADREGGSADWLAVQVQDTGIGIPADRRDAIFEKLEQGDPSISRRFGGSGLGLAIARHLAHAMGGDITVDSAPGVGSAFTLRVPLRAADAMEDDAAAAAAQPDEPGAPLRLLLVEDDAVNREVAMGLLGAAGHKVTVAETGERAVALATSDDFDAILLDIRLPDIDGVTAAGRIRAQDHPQRADTPIIAVTANVFAADRARYLEAGIDAVVEKPIFPERLTRTLAALSGRRGEALMPAAAGAALIPDENETDDSGGAAKDAAAAPKAAIDEEVLARYFAALGPTRFDAIRRLLEETAAEGLPRLTAADGVLDGPRLAEAMEVAHRLAGAGSHFGLTAFVAAMQRIEDLARDGQGRAATEAAAAAPAVFAEALAAMDDWRGRGSG